MSEKFRPHPENPKQNLPEAGAGPIGLPPPDPEPTNSQQGRAEGKALLSPVEQKAYDKLGHAVPEKKESAKVRAEKEIGELERLYEKLGLTPIDEERAKEIEKVRRLKLKPADVFHCTVPAMIPSKKHVEELLAKGRITEDEALRFTQARESIGIE